MLRNYITIALRHFWAHKSYVIFNIVGLAVAITVCILAYFHLAFNFQFNEMYKDTTQNIYRIDAHAMIDGVKREGASVSYPLIRSLMAEAPEIKQRIRYCQGDYGTSRIKVGDKYYKDYIWYTDSNFFHTFKHEFIYGNETALNDWGGIVLSDVDAKKYYGDENPLGKIVTLVYKGGKKDFVVRGVIKQATNNMFTFDAVARIEGFLSASAIDESSWKTYENLPEVFLEIPNKKDVVAVEKQLVKYVKTYNEFNPNKLVESYKLITFEDAGNRSFEIWNRATNSTWYSAFVVMLSSIALLILLIACFNYTNTSIALAGTRIKETSLRKVMGSQRKHIVVQFLIEHFIVSLLAVLLSIVFANLITPVYIGLYSEPEYGIYDFTSYDYIVPFLIFILIFTTLISGAYPAFYISKLKTADALRRNLKLKGGNRFTNALLTFQMIITVVGIGTGIVFTQNMDYIDRVDKGYSMENVIYIPMDISNGQRNFELFKSKIIGNPKILEIAGSQQHISWWSWLEKTKYKEVEYEALMLPTGENYLKTMGVKLLQGRFFEKDNYEDTNRVIINEMYMKNAAIVNPLNESIMLYGRPHKIVGVVVNFMQRGVGSKIKPMVITFAKSNGLMAVHASTNDIVEVNKFLEKTWLESFDKPYDGHLQITMLDQEKWIFRLLRTIFLYVSGIALLLSMVGLYVLVSLIIDRKTKEVGIRKIMGAPIQNIIYILGKKFIYIFGIALLVGSLLGLILAKGLLDKGIQIENHVDVTPLPFLLSGLLITLIAALTISFKIYKAANQNPVVSLRAE